MSKELTYKLNKPFKIIYRYRNDNRKFQYNYYIFLGNVPNNIRRIIIKIKNLNLIDSLLELSQDEINILEEYYDIYWYENLFLIEHINHTRQIFKSMNQKEKVIKKMSQEWVDKHLNTSKKTNLIYSYSGKLKIDRLKKQFIDEKIQSGGAEDDTDEDNIVEDTESEESEEPEEPEEPVQEPEPEESEQVEDFNVNELEEMHLINEDIDLEADKTKKKLDQLLEEDVNKSKIRKEKNIIFDQVNDTNNYNANIYDIFDKTYIYSQFIYSDDTILNMKKKICITIEKNKKFESTTPYFIPSRIYTWTNYTYNETTVQNNIKKSELMLGRNWLRQNSLLQVDIIPLDNFHDYEILKGHIGIIKESMNRYGSRIHTEDTSHIILNDYIDYIPNNEIYFTDIYTELGKGYKPSTEIQKNLIDFYVKIYFTEALFDFTNIIDYLNGNYTNELKKIRQVITTIDNDLSLENQIMSYIENEYVNKENYEKYYKYNFITQTTTHVSLFLTKLNGIQLNIEKETTSVSLLKFDLHRIFENFTLSENYPYIQYQPPDAAGWHKFRTITPEYDRESIQSKWLESNPYGISFKIKVDIKGGAQNKYISVKLSEYGRLEYKTQWKEEDMATFEDINKTFQYIQDLIIKINEENTHFQIYIPNQLDFKFAFINNIQSFQLPIAKNSYKS